MLTKRTDEENRVLSRLDLFRLRIERRYSAMSEFPPLVNVSSRGQQLVYDVYA